MIHLILSLLLAMNFTHVDDAINESIQAKDAPGAVLLLGKNNQVVYRKAYGNKSLVPTTQPMTEDTIFDMASCTKCIATATSTMILVERHKIDLHETVGHYIPDFVQNGKDKVTVEMLLTHTSGLIADNPNADYENGPDEAYKKINALSLQHPAGTYFTYSDVNFEVLGELVHIVDGRPLDVFATEEVFKPLGMNDTGFKPDAKLKSRIAPTEMRKGTMLLGEVHDPHAAALGGVAGHAGLFSTADDVGKWCQMFTGGKSVLKPETIALMTTPHDEPKGGKVKGKFDPDKDNGQRGLGVDFSSPFASCRGERFEKGTTFGHTGYTGTMFWIDPKNKCYMVLLTARVHPKDPDDEGKAIVRMRKLVATECGKALLDQ